MAAPALCRRARGPPTADAAQAWLRRAVAALAPDPAAPERAPSDAVRRLIGRVQAGVLAGEHTVAGLARRCAVSRERLHRVLSTWRGLSPAACLRAVRLHRARRLLVGGAPVAAVAAECGFADQARFTRWFRRRFDCTPGDLVQALPRAPGQARSSRQVW